jgi:hypothetical protein
MLMVIFGAGASFDSTSTYPPGAKVLGGNMDNNFHRPPLANELFENRPLFAQAIDRFPECRPIVPRLRNLEERSIETVLENIQGEAEAYVRAKQELAAVRCYLHRVITETENEWQVVIRHITNYLTLLREIERTHPKEPVCLVTFNYDTLLEDALLHFGLHIDAMFDYTQKHAFYRVFKLHGSINWARQVEPEIVSKSDDPDTTLRRLIQRVAELRITDGYIFSRDRVMGIVQGKLAFPAIAIPVETKRSFECPPSQLEELVALLPKVSKMLVIGWRATEAHFLALLGNRLTGLRPGVRLHVVAANDGEAEDIKVRICRALLNNPPSLPSVDPGGFTDFILSGRVAQFLGD